MILSMSYPIQFLHTSIVHTIMATESWWVYNPLATVNQLVSFVYYSTHNMWKAIFARTKLKQLSMPSAQSQEA